MKLLTALLALITLPALAQPAPVPALFLSDIHFDPYADPAKVAKLSATPFTRWPQILSAPPSATLAQDSAALQKACPVHGTDTNSTLWQSSLRAIRANASTVRFVTIGGDLLAHQFDCKFRILLPSASPAEYVAFTQKTAGYLLAGIHSAVPAAPIYLALGNNDSACADYALDPVDDAFLAGLAPLVVARLPKGISAADRRAVLRDFAAGGYYSAPLASVPHTRILVLDDVFLSAHYSTCARKPDPAPAVAQLAWLQSQLAAARKHHERVWIMGHISPGVDLYATARMFTNICGGQAPQMFLASDALPNAISAASDVVRLVLFGHTHSDEMSLLAAPPGSPVDLLGVPVKTIPSITPVNGNNPSFTLARIDPSTASLLDYTVIMASNQTGVATKWSPEYTYSATYHQPAFDAASVAKLIAGFRADPLAGTPEARAYLDFFAPPSSYGQLLQFVWPQYVCAMDHLSATEFAACSCAPR
jgi:sphingomyelin phosphodiesterase acid-like 3